MAMQMVVFLGMVLVMAGVVIDCRRSSPRLSLVVVQRRDRR
jgi:hypothetical protein